MKVEIYQLQPGQAQHDIRFAPYDEVKRLGRAIDAKNYQRMYQCDRDDDYGLESAYREFNVDRPDDFHGHSLSVSDVVVTIRNEEGRRAFYCDRFGFKEVPEFDPDDAYIPTPDEGAQG